jgi:hypothetical protein
MMRFTKIDGPEYRAEKVSKTGAIYYVYWVDERGNQYVQIVRNVGGGGVGTGSFSPDLYLINDIGTPKQLNGYDPATGDIRPSNDNNMSAFLKAIKINIDKLQQEERINGSGGSPDTDATL